MNESSKHVPILTPFGTKAKSLDSRRRDCHEKEEFQGLTSMSCLSDEGGVFVYERVLFVIAVINYHLRHPLFLKTNVTPADYLMYTNANNEPYYKSIALKYGSRRACY